MEEIMKTLDKIGDLLEEQGYLGGMIVGVVQKYIKEQDEKVKKLTEQLEGRTA